MPKKKQRIPIPKELAAVVLYKSHRTCCVCREPRKRVQLHHIDDDPSNNTEPNLAVLCTEHHNETRLSGDFGRKLDDAQVRLYKATWEEAVSDKRLVHSRVDSQSIPSSAPLEETPLLKPEAADIWPKPKLLVEVPFNENLINDNRERHVFVQNGSWHPFTSEPKRRQLLGFQNYPKEYEIRHPFRSFSALVSPNAESFELVMKLMNEVGTLPVHMAHGEVSFMLKNDIGSESMHLGFLEAGVSSERPLAALSRPRFEVELKVRPMHSSRLLAAQLYINRSLVQTQLIPREYTARFGIVASGNGKPCHMSFSDILVTTATT